MGTQAFDAKRFTGWMMAPEDLVIIGLDTDDGPEHPLYHARVNLPLDEQKIANIDAHGIIQPVQVRKNGGAAEVVAGRQRVRMARVVNERRRARDGRKYVPLLVPVVKSDGDEKMLAARSYSENAVRTNDDVIEEAKNMARLKAQGYTEKEVAVHFGCSHSVVLKRLGLLELAPPVIKAVQSGKIAPTMALGLKGLSHDEQKKKLGAMASSSENEPSPTNGKATNGKKRPTEQEVKAALGKRVVPGKKQAAKMVETGLLKDASAEEYLRYVAGEIPASKVKGLTAALRAVGLGE